MSGTGRRPKAVKPVFVLPKDREQAIRVQVRERAEEAMRTKVQQMAKGIFGSNKHGVTITGRLPGEAQIKKLNCSISLTGARLFFRGTDYRDSVLVEANGKKFMFYLSARKGWQPFHNLFDGSFITYNQKELAHSKDFFTGVRNQLNELHDKNSFSYENLSGNTDTSYNLFYSLNLR